MDTILRITPGIQQMFHVQRKKHVQADKAHLQAQRQAIIDVVLARFPNLKHLSQQQTSISNNTALLATFVTRLILAYDEPEAKLLLLSIQPAG